MDGTVQADYNAQQYIMSSPALGDIDGDGNLEVVFGGYSSPGKLFAINSDGSPVDGFPIQLGEKIQRGVALADFNGDNIKDIIVGTDGEKIHVIYSDGTEAPGFPFEADNDFRSAPSVVDIGGEKIIVAGNRDDNFYGINSDGSLRFVVETGGDISTSAGFGPTPFGLGIFFGSDDGYLYGVDIFGEALPNWPQYLEDDVICSPVIVDIDGDGTYEVVAAVDGTRLYAFHMDGNLVNHFPIHYGDFPFKGSPVVTDIDIDGDLEIMIGTARSIVNVDIKELSQSFGWNMYRGNLERTGYYESDQSGDITVDIDHMSDWNLVGLPVSLSDTDQTLVYPNAIEGTLFSFSDSYELQENLVEGLGYWLRFPSSGLTTLTGDPITSLDLSLQSDWNLISGLSSSIEISGIFDPEGIIIPGTIFGFGESYELSDIIEPGKAYWLRAVTSGEVYLGVGLSSRRMESIPKAESNRLIAKGMTLYFGKDVENKLHYSMPPLPPEGVFDIRFSDNTRVCEDECELEVRGNLSGTEITFDFIDDDTWELIDEYGNMISLDAGFIDSEDLVQRYKLRRSISGNPSKFYVDPAYPNPFNPETTIRFTVVEPVDVTVEIYDILGRQISNIMEGMLQSGNHSFIWNGTDNSGNSVSAGIYFLQINTIDSSQRMKLILLK
tara:strand:- start:126 stop:2120 length:1995 start_codon:yes stop_codon:yes gene_type:complete